MSTQPVADAFRSKLALCKFCLILTRFQPGDSAYLNSQTVSTVYLPPRQSETVETVRTSSRKLDHPVETG